MKFIKENWQKLFLFILTLFLPVTNLFAQVVTCDEGKICNPINSSSIPEFIQKFLTGALKIGMPIVALAVIYSGFLFVAARGNSEKLNKAKSALLYTLIGAAILLGSWAIAELIAETVTSL